MEILDRFGVKSPTTRSLPAPLCPIASRFPSPLGVKSPTIGFAASYDLSTEAGQFPSPLGAKSPTIRTVRLEQEPTAR